MKKKQSKNIQKNWTVQVLLIYDVMGIKSGFKKILSYAINSQVIKCTDIKLGQREVEYTGFYKN